MVMAAVGFLLVGVGVVEAGKPRPLRLPRPLTVCVSGLPRPTTLASHRKPL